MASIRIVGGASVTKVSQQLKSRAQKMAERNVRNMERITKGIERDLKMKHMAGTAQQNSLYGKVGAKSPLLGKVTGKARQSIVSMVFTRMLGVVGVVGSPLEYVRAHEFGATIRGNQYLRIPTKFMKKGSGQDRLQGRSARTLKQSTAIFRSRAGNLFIWEVGTARAKAAGKPIPLYILKPSVTLKARHFMRNALRAARPKIRAAFAGAFDRVA